MRNIIQHINNTIILFGIMVFLFPLQAKSQVNSVLDSVITFKPKNITLYEGLNLIADEINYEFSYNSDLIASESIIKANFENTSVQNVLNGILNDSTLMFHVADKQIIILKRNTFGTLSTINSGFEIGKHLQLYGSVFDKKSKKPLSFANVALLGKSIGSVTNEQGRFNLKIEQSNLKDTLVISYIGYRNSYIPINQLSLFNNKIFLEEDLFKIQEVVIRIDDPRSLIYEAISNIKYNYYTGPYYITSFYREIVTNRNELTAISEAIIEVYKSPYLGFFSDQIKLIKSRKNEYYSIEDTVSLKLKGGLFASLYLDAIKNPSNFLRVSEFHNYVYHLSEIVNYDDNTAYVIEFKPIKYLDDQTYEGKVYINTKNLAIVAIDFKLTEEAVKKAAGNLVIKKKMGTRVKPTSVRYQINYRKINNKYFMNLARGELEFKVKYKRKLFSSDFKTVFEFASNDIDTVDVARFNRVETIPTHKIFIDEDYQYDREFWGDYNYISPEETIEEALIRIQRKLEELEEN